MIPVQAGFYIFKNNKVLGRFLGSPALYRIASFSTASACFGLVVVQFSTGQFFVPLGAVPNKCCYNGGGLLQVFFHEVVPIVHIGVVRA